MASNHRNQDQFQNCPLCRKPNFTAKFSRLMVTVLSQYKLFCPAVECHESVPYAKFANHKESCPALNKKPCPQCKKLFWKNDFQDHFVCFNELTKTLKTNEEKTSELQWQISELELKIKAITQSRDAHAQNNKNLKISNQNITQRNYQLESDLAFERGRTQKLQDELANEKKQIESQKVLVKEYEDEFRHLQIEMTADKQKIQNQKNALSGLHKKVSEQKIIEKKLEQDLCHYKGSTKKHLDDLESKNSSLLQSQQELKWQLQQEFQQRENLTKKLHETKQQSEINLGKAEMSAMTISRLRSKINKMNIESKSQRDLKEELESAYQQIAYLNKQVSQQKSSQKNSGLFGLFKK